MPPKTIKKAIKNCLENLKEGDFEKFRDELLDRREPPRIATSRVEGKNFMVVTDVMVTTFGEAKALEVVVELLEEIECQKDAAALVEETKELTKAGSSKSAGSSAGAAGVTPKSDGGFTEHFVDKHKDELIQRMSNIAPILDQLLTKKVIHQEGYDTIRAKPTSQDQVRELYKSLNARACKDIFYEILEKQARFLIEDLKNNE